MRCDISLILTAKKQGQRGIDTETRNEILLTMTQLAQAQKHTI